jgi:uncharacterized cupredoxin-like copper-binding protein
MTPTTRIATVGATTPPRVPGAPMRRSRSGRGRRTPLVALTATGFAGVLALGVPIAAPAGAGSSPTTVKATETDFHIALSKKSFSPGTYTFVAINKGQVTHALQITGPGLKNSATKDISPGQSAKLTVTFKKGAYDVFCPVPGHKAMGMNANIVVGGSAGGSSGSAGTGSSSHGSSSSGGYGY